VRTIQVTIDEPLLDRLDDELSSTHQPRSAFIRNAIENELRRRDVEAAERAWEESYRKNPVDEKEMAAWESIQDWGDPWDEPEA
jgi:predicted transcriptional regulator